MPPITTAGLAGLLACGIGATAAAPPNIIFTLVDDVSRASPAYTVLGTNSRAFHTVKKTSAPLEHPSRPTPRFLAVQTHIPACRNDAVRPVTAATVIEPPSRRGLDSPPLTPPPRPTRLIPT